MGNFKYREHSADHPCKVYYFFRKYEESTLLKCINVKYIYSTDIELPCGMNQGYKDKVVSVYESIEMRNIINGFFLVWLCELGHEMNEEG